MVVYGYGTKRRMAMDPTSSLSLSIQMARYELGLLQRKNERAYSILQFYNKTKRVIKSGLIFGLVGKINLSLQSKSTSPLCRYAKLTGLKGFVVYRSQILEDH